LPESETLLRLLNDKDLVKINHQLRDYDFKKNLERKLGLTEAAQKLLGVNDVVSAYRNMQQLFQQWREIGPVPREKRDEQGEGFVVHRDTPCWGENWRKL